MKFTRRKEGHDAGTMNCPVGETIKGPASLQMRNKSLLNRLLKAKYN